jgi:signal transduction histidine kinase
METLTDCNLQFKTIIKEIDSKEEALKLELMTLDINHAEIELFQYLNNYDQNHINIAMERLEEASEKVVKLSRPSHVRLLSKHIQQLRTSILNISQVIQGYLYFANVVMAADASELLYQAKGLDEVSTQRQRAIQDDVLNASSRSLKIILIFCLVVFCLSIVLTIVLGRSITTPIDQLKETFSSLSSGKRVDVIPCIDARNELGELARSANVFKQKNEETKLLLQESKTLTQELKTRETELAKSNDELEQFVFTVSHDLKSPLVTSIGYISMAKDVLEDGDVARGVELMGRVMKANERMSQLITDLLDLSRVGREEDEFLEVSIYNCLASVKGNLAHSISSNNVKLVIEDNLPSVYGHESRLMQVFENLIGNAIKYGAPEEGQPIVKVSHVSGSETIHITIEDKGKGIPKEYHKKVFGLFSRLDHEKEGTGIGLAVVRKVMTSHGGKVWIENGLNGGASFHLEFPRRQIEKS